MEIRLLVKNDLPALLCLYGHLHPTDDPLPPQREVDDIWLEIMSNDRFQYFGGFIGGEELVTSCTIATIPNLTRGCKPYGIIENVVTHSDHRRNGFGTAILHAALSYAWSRGCYKVMLQTGRKDEATLRFYQSAGFDSNAKQAFVAKPDS